MATGLPIGRPWRTGSPIRLAGLRAAGAVYRHLAVVVLGAVLALLVIYPIGLLLYGVFSKAPPQSLTLSFDNLTFDNVESVATSGTMWRAVLTSFTAVTGATVIALAIGLFFAWVVARTNVRAKRFIEMAALLPLFISPLVAGIAWARLALPNSGLVNVGLREAGVPIVIDIGSVLGIAFVMGLYYAPYAYLLLVGSLRNLDPALEEAAAVCGAGQWYTIRRITLPLVAHALYSAVLLVMVGLLALYSIPFLLGEQQGLTFMTTYLWRLVTQSPPDYQAAAAVGLFLTVLTMIGVVLQRRVLGRRRFTTITGRAYRPRLMDVGRWRHALVAAAVLYIVVAAVLPYLALGLTAFREVQFFSGFGDIFATSALSLANFEELFDRPELSRSITNSLIVGLGTAVLGVALSFGLAYVLDRTRLRGRGLLRAIASVPIAIPGIIIGVAFLWAWIGLPVGLYGTLPILILAFVARHIPDALQSISSTMVQVHEELEESARICGASWLRTVRRILLPLVRGGLASAATLLFVFSVREIGPALFLYNADTTIMSVQVIASWEVGDVGSAAAIALVQSAVLLVVVSFARRVLQVDVART
jgi:iron(III) transport system permease protein